MENPIFEWHNGNPGAAIFLSLLLTHESYSTRETIIPKLKEAKSIRGTNLYVLWSDLCEKDMMKVEALCKNCPTDILEDACRRQDYSGLKLVNIYFTQP